jgi:uncharacterized membrane protein YkgB
MRVGNFDKTVIEWFRRSFIPVARFSIFLTYFWFGILKIFDLSPASPLASALTAKTIGLQNFNLAFKILAVYECLIGVLFLFPKTTRLVIPMLLVHLVIVCSPLILISHMVWTRPFVPTLEGQYIIKNIAIIAVAIGIAAQVVPIKKQAR